MNQRDSVVETRDGWLEISIEIHPVARESLSAFLFDLGCTGIVIQDGQDPAVRAYLPAARGLGETRGAIEAFLTEVTKIFPEIKSPGLTLGHLENQDWERDWRRFFYPARVTPTLMIYPAWEPVAAPTLGQHVIRIDPGPAFGTGQHPSTRMCLEAMEEVCPPEPWSLLDVGTGSGILAIYGAKLGAVRVVGTDIDAEALRWAERNIQLNGFTKAITLSSKSLLMWEECFSVVTANLILDVIVELMPHLEKVMRPDAVLILSGLLRNQIPTVSSALAAGGLRRKHIRYEEEWACLLAVKQP
jgi:ribosomal protein L11 methyltransferase